MVVLPRERTLIVEEISAVLLSASNRAVLGGQPGVGKSTVLDALVEHVLEQPGTMVLRSRSLREGPHVPFHGLRDLFADLDVADFTLPEAQRDALLGALGRSHPSETPPHLLYLAIDSVLRELSTRFTVIIAIDDLDVIDHDTHEVIKFVTHRPSNTGRRESYIGTITSDPLLFGSESTFDLAACAVEELYALPPLSRGAFTSVLASSSRFTVGESDVDELFRRTGGNPLWAFELYYQTTAGAPLRNVPKSLSMVTRTKIESLTAPTIRLLGALSLLDSASRDELISIADVDADDIVAALRAGLIREDRERLVPTHIMLATAALDHLGPEAQAAFHRDIYSMSVDIRQRAHHLDRSTAPGADEFVASLLYDAGLLCRSVDDLSGALGFMRRAVARTPLDSEARPDRELALAEILFARGALDESIRILADLIYSPLSIARLDRALPAALMAIAARDGEAEAIQFLARLTSIGSDDPAILAVLMTYQAEVASDPAERRALASESLAQLRAAGAAPLTKHRAIGSLIGADLDAGLGLDSTLLQEAQQLESELDTVALNDSANGQRGLFAYQTGDLETSRRALEIVRKRAAASGQVLMAGVFNVHLATVQVYSGQVAAASATLDEWESFEAFISPPPSVIAARGLLLLREVDESALRHLVALPHEHGSEVIASVTRAALTGVAAARRQRWDEAVFDLERARSLSVESGVKEPGRRMWVDFTLARTYVALGRLEEAAAISAELRALSHGTRPLLDGVACRIDGLLAALSGDAGLATRMLRQSVGLLASAGYPTEIAVSLLELGRQLHTTRARAEAIETFTRASEIAEAGGDLQLAAMIAQTQAEVGTRTSRSLLSAREQAVAEDAAAGKTNREIAGAHFLSVRTVETQLSSAYRKLGVRSRSELTALLSRESVDD